MTIAFGITPVAPEDLLTLIESYLAQVTGLGDRAFLSLWPDRYLLQNPRADSFLTITPNGFPVWQSVVDGSGFGVNPPDPLGLTGYNASLTLTCYVRNTADPEVWSSNLIRDQVLGLTVLTGKVAAAIQGWIPVDNQNNPLVREYARMSDAGWRFDSVDLKGNVWAKASISMELRFSVKFPQLPQVIVTAPIS